MIQRIGCSKVWLQIEISFAFAPMFSCKLKRLNNFFTVKLFTDIAGVQKTLC